MNDREIMEAAIRGMGDTTKPVEDSRPFWLRLILSIRAKVSGTPTKPKVEITGGAEF